MMTTQSKLLFVTLFAFLLGTAGPALLIWNPAGWDWADEIVGRGHAEHSMSAAPSSSPSMGVPGAVAQLWTCGMHPHVVSEKPGNCPVCGMRMTPVKDTSVSSAGAGGTPSGERKILYWRAPMNPSYTSDKPGKSPMGMDLVPVYEDKASVEAGVRVDPNFLQNFGVRTALVERGAIPIEIRTLGTLVHNEESLVSVSTKFAGWIEKAYFNNVGEHVMRGDVLFDVYSPELVTTQQEYLAALDYVDRLSGSAYPEAVERARSLLEATRDRLQYWDISEEQIRQLDQSRQTSRTVKVFSPASGLIVGKMGNSLEGMRLTPGMVVLKLGSHSKLWAKIELYENDVRYVREGTPVRVEVSAFPGRSWRGKVVLFDGAVDPRTRTLAAYVEIDNSDMKLRPNMFADVVIRPVAVRGAVKVPQQAILHSGERAVVIVEKAKGVFEPREVELGTEGGGFQEVRRGLKAGERIVTSSQFLIDSESNLKAAISQLLGSRRNTKDSLGKDALGKKTLGKDALGKEKLPASRQ